jgi:hypothetical protein
MERPNLNKIIADNLDKAKFQSKSSPILPTNGWLDQYKEGGTYISDRAKATQFGQYKKGGGYFPEYHSFAPPRMNNGGGLLSRTVTCSNCGWSWKAVDGGKDVMTCHKCGGMIKMKEGGAYDQYDTGGEPCVDAQGNVVPCDSPLVVRLTKEEIENKRLKELGTDAYSAMQPFYNTVFEAAQKYANPNTGLVSPFNNIRAALKGAIKHPSVLFMKRHELPNEELDPYHTGNYSVDNPGRVETEYWPHQWAEPRKEHHGLSDWIERMRLKHEENKAERKNKRNRGNTGCYGANCTENELQDQAKYGGSSNWTKKYDIGGLTTTEGTKYPSVESAANGDVECSAFPKKGLRHANSTQAGTSTSDGGKNDPDKDKKDARWAELKPTYGPLGVTKADVNMAFEDSARVAPAFMAPYNVAAFNPQTGVLLKNNGISPGAYSQRLKYYNQVPGFQFGQIPTVTQILDHQLAEPGGLKIYRKNYADGFSWPIVPVNVKHKNGGTTGWLTKYAPGGVTTETTKAPSFMPNYTMPRVANDSNSDLVRNQNINKNLTVKNVNEAKATVADYRKKVPQFANLSDAEILEYDRISKASQQRQQQATIKQSKPQSTFHRVMDIAKHPITAFAYKAKGQDIPKNLGAGETNSYDMVAGFPAQVIQSGLNLFTDNVMHPIDTNQALMKGAVNLFSNSVDGVNVFNDGSNQKALSFVNDLANVLTLGELTAAAPIVERTAGDLAIMASENAAKNTAETLTKNLVQDIAQPIKQPWAVQELPGLHLNSTMSNGPIFKIIEPKTGLINVDQALSIIGKESGGADKVALIKKALGESIPKKMDFNDFRKITQEQLIPLDQQLVNHSSNYGLYSIGYPSPKRASFESAIKVTQDELQKWTKILEETKAKGAEFDDIENHVNGLKERLQNSYNDLNNLPLENQTLILSNKNKFGRGSNAHNNPRETLGHIHFLRDAETPDILTVTQLQSDAFQGSNRIMPKVFNKESELNSLENMKDIAKRQEEMAKTAKQIDSNTWELSDGTQVSKSVWENMGKHQKEINAMKKAEIENFSQKSLLDKNHQDRFLQELVDYAGKRGDINKVRLPTPETAAKIQGYKKLSSSTIGPTTKALLDKVNSFEEFFQESLDSMAMTANDVSHLDKDAMKKIYDSYKNGKTIEPTYSPSHQTILKKYAEQPKLVKKLFGTEPKIVTDGKGNTWYEFDIPETFKQGKGQIKAFKQGGEWLNKYDDGGLTTPTTTKAPSFVPRGLEFINNNLQQKLNPIIFNITQPKSKGVVPNINKDYRTSNRVIADNTTIVKNPIQTIGLNQKQAPQIRAARPETELDKENRIRLNQQYQASHPYSVIDDQGNLSKADPDRDMNGLPYPHTRAAANDRFLDKAMNAIEVTSALSGAGQIGSNFLRLGASALEKQIGRNLLSKGLKTFTSRVNPFLNSLDEAASYVQLDPIGIMGNRLNSKFYNPTTALNTANNTITGVGKNLKNSAIEATDLALGENNLDNLTKYNKEDDYTSIDAVKKYLEKIKKSGVPEYKEVPMVTGSFADNIYTSEIIPTKEINFWEEPNFKKRNPNFKIESYLNYVKSSGNKELPENMKTRLIRDMSKEEYKKYTSELRKFSRDYWEGLNRPKQKQGGSINWLNQYK